MSRGDRFVFVGGVVLLYGLLMAGIVQGNKQQSEDRFVYRTEHHCVVMGVTSNTHQMVWQCDNNELQIEQ